MSTALREVFARFRTQFDDRALKRGETVTNRLTQSMRGLVASFAGLYAAGRIKSSITDFANMADEMGKTARVVGMSTQALQAWRHASNLSGVGAEAFNAGLIRLQRSMLDAQRGSATARDAFQRLGVNVEDSSGQLRGADEILRDMADPLANLESSSERVGLLSTVMGRSGARMGPLFERGAEGVREMTAELAEFGGGVSDESIAAAESYNDTLARMDLAFLSVKSRLATTLLPALERLAETVTHLIKDTNVFQALLVTGVAAGALKAAGALRAMGVAGALAGAKTLATFGLAAVGVVAVILVFEDLITAIKGGDSVLGDFTEAMEDFVDLHEDEDSGMGAVARWWDDIVSTVSDGIAAVAEFLGLADDVPDFDDIESGEFTRVRGLRAPGAETVEQETARELRMRGELGAPSTTLDSEEDRVVRRFLETGSTALRAPAEAMPTTTIRGLQPPPSISNTQTVSVTVNGGDPEEVQRVVRREMDRSNRGLLDSLAGGVASGEGI